MPPRKKIAKAAKAAEPNEDGIAPEGVVTPSRRSTRSSQVNYKEEVDSSDAGENAEDDDDFVQIKPKQTNSRNGKRKRNLNKDDEFVTNAESEDSDNSEESVDLPDNADLDNKGVKRKRGRTRDTGGKEPERRPSLSTLFKPVSLTSEVKRELKLSDSESDEEARDCSTTVRTPVNHKEEIRSHEQKETLVVTELEDPADQETGAAAVWTKNLSALGIDTPRERNQQEKQKETRKQKTAGKRKSSAKAKKVDSSMDVAKLLKLGEKEEVEEPSEDDNWQEVTETPSAAVKPEKEHEAPRDVQVMVALPEAKKRRKFDFMEHVRKKMNRIRKAIQIDLHKVHLVCLLASGHHINVLLNDATLAAAALSVIPSNQCYPPKRTDLNYLEKLVKWFTKKFLLERAVDHYYPVPLIKSLMNCYVTSKARCVEEYVYMFVAICRALGMNTRLVISLQPLPLKPPTADLVPNGNPRRKSTESDESEAKPGASKDSEDAGRPKKAKKGKTPVKKPVKKEATSKKATKSEEKKKPAKPEGIKKKPDQKKEETITSRRSRGSKRTTYKEESTSSDSDFEKPAPRQEKESSTKKKKPSVNVKSRNIVSSESEDPQPEAQTRKRDSVDYWVEIYLEHEEQWISVDVTSGKVHCERHLESRTSQLVYAVAFNPDGTHKDVTRRYASSFHNVTRKLRVDPDWMDKVMNLRKELDSARSRAEDQVLDQQMMDRPLPTSISEYKNHPLYALRRHLLKFEAIYPPSAVPLGYVRGEPVYARECVKQLHSRETWLKEAKVVRLGEKAYKIVKARPKWDKLSQKIVTDQPLEIFGEWQVEDYVPPPAVDGKVPRNAYGNVELFKPSMLPKGTVHLPIAGLNKVARKLGIDCAPAMTGWDFHGGWSHPVYDGFVVCEEYVETLLDAWQADQAEQERREREKREKRVYDNWRRLIRGLLIKQRLEAKYLNLGDDPSQDSKEDKPSPSSSKSSIHNPLKPAVPTLKSRRKSLR